MVWQRTRMPPSLQAFCHRFVEATFQLLVAGLGMTNPMTDPHQRAQKVLNDGRLGTPN